MNGSMLEGKRNSRITRIQLGRGGSLGIFTGRPKSLKGSSKSPSSSSSSAAAGASSFFCSPGGGGGGGGGLLGAAEVRQKINGYILFTKT